MSTVALPEHTPLGPEHQRVVVEEEGWGEPRRLAMRDGHGEEERPYPRLDVNLPSGRAFFVVSDPAWRGSVVYRRASDVRKAPA